MIIVDIDCEDYINSSNKIFFEQLGYNDSFDWKCAICGEEHHESEYRNFQRRKTKCACQFNRQRFKEIEEELNKVNYSFLHDKENSYQVSKNGKIECKKPILVKCLNCSKESYEYYHNIRKGHKKCNCNITKKFTRNLTVDDFIEKWSKLTRDNFELLSQEYHGRNAKYKIKCKKCGKEDERWGITLIDNDNSCKYCDHGSKYEQLIGILLDKKNIRYIREYLDIWNGHYHRFDFFLPDRNMIIEYNGQQHYEPIEYFGGEEQFRLRQERDKEKEQYCQDKNLQLIVFNYQQTSEEIEKKIGLIFNDYPEKE